MNPKLFLTIFSTVFLAELFDKTQLATIMFSAKAEGGRLGIFLAAASALVVASAIGVLAGAAMARLLNPKVVSWVAGIGFIVVGVWTIARA
jgi:putative Ca2+/H+ antiporter (TMEM165/GDT1 family)